MASTVDSAAWMALTKRVIGPAKDPYLIRLVVLQTPLFSLYIHKLCRSDYEKALHDHPWGFISLVLSPYAEEITELRGVTRSVRVSWFETHRCGDILFRRATHRHRVIIHDRRIPGWTVVLTGPRTRPWGFWPWDRVKREFRWCHWKSFNQELGICEAGPIAGRTGLD